MSTLEYTFRNEPNVRRNVDAVLLSVPPIATGRIIDAGCSSTARRAARNLPNATAQGFRSPGTIDLGDGNILRNNAVVRVKGGHISASCVMYGTARTGDLAARFFEVTVLPSRPGKVAGLAVAGGGDLTAPDATVSSILFSTVPSWLGAHSLQPACRQRTLARLGVGAVETCALSSAVAGEAWRTAGATWGRAFAMLMGHRLSAGRASPQG